MQPEIDLGATEKALPMQMRIACHRPAGSGKLLEASRALVALKFKTNLTEMLLRLLHAKRIG